MVHLDDAERRRRLGVRHALAAPVRRTEDVVEAVAALHSTDPAAMVLAVLARLAEPEVADVERALYADRTVTRVLTMRRTVFAVPSTLVPTFLASTESSVADSERRKLAKLAADQGYDAAWVAAVHAAALRVVDGLGVFSSAELAAADPLLATRFEIAPGTKYATTQAIASRLLTLMSAEGHVVRTRPAGTWASTQFRWAAMHRWLPDLPPRPDAAAARAEVARRWLARFGPATPSDLQWWSGWTKGHTSAALAAVGAIEVDTDSGPAVILPGDDAPTPPPAPWVALLPALDATTMGWKQRDWYLGPHAERVFDTNGNAGPTVWVDGRIAGGWAIRDDGTVAVELLTDVGSEAADRAAAEAARIEQRLAGAVPKARARGWTPVERDLRNR